MPAKFNLLVAASIPAAALIPLLACGGGGGGKADSGIIVHDSSNGSNGSGSNVTCSFPATFSPGMITRQYIGYAAIGQPINGQTATANRIDMQGLLGGSGSAVQILRVAMFGGCGATGANCQGGSGIPTPDWPAAFAPKSNLDLGADGSGHALAPDIFLELLTDVGSDNTFQTYYISVGGKVNITAAADGSGKPFAGNVASGDFVHIDIGTSGITQDPDGCESIIGSASWSGSSVQAQFDGKNIGGIIVEPANERDYMIRDWLRHRTM